MKRISSFLFIIIIILLFAACNKSAVVSEYNDSNRGFYTVPSTVETSTTKNNKITHKDIEKVIICYFDLKEEYTESEQNFDYLDNIKNCKDTPNLNMAQEIGSIKIKYIGKKKVIKYASLFLTKDGSIYAKYVNSKNDKYAYKLR